MRACWLSEFGAQIPEGWFVVLDLTYENQMVSDHMSETATSTAGPCPSLVLWKTTNQSQPVVALKHPWRLGILKKRNQKRRQAHKTAPHILEISCFCTANNGYSLVDFCLCISHSPFLC